MTIYMGSWIIERMRRRDFISMLRDGKTRDLEHKMWIKDKKTKSFQVKEEVKDRCELSLWWIKDKK